MLSWLLSPLLPWPSHFLFSPSGLSNAHSPHFFSTVELWCLPLSFHLSPLWLRLSCYCHFMGTDWRYSPSHPSFPCRTVEPENWTGTLSVDLVWDGSWGTLTRRVQSPHRGKSSNSLPFRSGDGHIILKRKDADNVTRKKRAVDNTGKKRSRSRSKPFSSQMETKGVRPKENMFLVTGRRTQLSFLKFPREKK